MKPNKIDIMPYGISISLIVKAKDYNKTILKGNMLEIKKLIVALSGPFTNLIIIVYLILFCKNTILNKNIIFYSNLLIMIFNLLPIYPLDGGRILKCLLHIFCGRKKAEIIINKSSNIIMILITFIGSIGVYYFENISIFIVVMFLWCVVIRENKKHKMIMKAYEMIGGAIHE